MTVRNTINICFYGMLYVIYAENSDAFHALYTLERSSDKPFAP